MKAIVKTIVGPRVPSDELRQNFGRYVAPRLVLVVARAALLISIFVPYWEMELQAPQYPDGLTVQAYVNRLTGDVREIDGLNHYIGMRPLGEAAEFERTVSVALLIALLLMVEGAVYVHTKWVALILLPAILLPVFFLADLHYWMSMFGQNLDPTAPLANSIEPFTPPVLGVGIIGQFKTVAWPGPGLILATIASVLTLVALFLHRRAFRPLVKAAQAGDPVASPDGEAT